MSFKSSVKWSVLRQWFNAHAFFDGWFVLLERSREAFHGLLDCALPGNRELAKRRRPRYLPQCEGMEARLVPSTLNFVNTTQSVNYNATLLQAQVSLDTSSSDTITVEYSTDNGTASAGTDFMGISNNTLTFLPGVTLMDFTVTMLDHKESSNVNFSLQLSSPSNAALGSAITDTVTIVETPLVAPVVDLKSDVVLPSNATPINSFSTWNMSLAAEVSGADYASYQWDFSGATDAGSITGSTSYDPTFTWANFSGSRTDTVALTETVNVPGANGWEELTQDYVFKVAGTDSTAWVSSSPTSASTWPSVITPDMLNGQDMIVAGPYAEVGQVDGSAQTSFSLPAYNPNATPLGLDYSSAVADPQPIFLVNYQLGSSLPTTVNATLSVNGSAGSTVYYDPSQLNSDDNMEIALQATSSMLSGLSTGRYSWNITVTTSPATTTMTYSGYFDLITGSTTPTTLTNSPFGTGWSLDDVTRLWPVSGGVILQRPDGSSLWFASSGGNYTTPAGDFSTLTYSTATTEYTRTMPDGTEYLYNSSGAQIAVLDRNGNTTTFNYNSSGQLTTVEDVNSAYSTITYNGTTGLVTRMANPSPDFRTETLTYSTAKDLTSITDPNSNFFWSYAYDSSHHLTTIKDPRSTGSNYITTFTYNSASQVSSVTQPDSTTLLFSPQQSMGLAIGSTSSSPAPAILNAAADAVYTDGNGHTWTEEFDGLGLGRPVEITDPVGDTAMSYRDANDLPWLSANALGRRQRLFFNSQGDVVTLVNADETYHTASYNSFAEPLTETTRIGSTNYTTTYNYDSSGNLTSAEDALTNITTYTYTTSGLKGLLLTETKPLAASNAGLYTTTYGYDSSHRLSTITRALTTSSNIVETFTYDSDGEIATFTNPDGVVTTYSHDALNHLTMLILADATGVVSTYTYSYDKVENLTAEVVPLTSTSNATYTYAFDSMNRFTKETDPLSNVTTYSYDSDGNLTGLTNALGYTTTYGFDAASRQTSVTIPLTSTTSATTTYMLDAAGETTAIKNALNQVTTLAYNSRGWLASVTNPLGDVTSYSYDAIGDETGITQTDTSSHSLVTTMTYYDDTGLRETKTDPLGYLTTYSYDADYNLTSVQGVIPANTYTYDALDRQVSANIGGATTTYGFDNAGLFTTVTDAASNVTTFTYDRQGRVLTSVNPLSGTTTYSYNLAGWLTTIIDPDSNTTTYAYDADGRLTQTTNPNGYTATYSYDAIGEKTATTDYDGRQTTFSYNRAGWLTGETWVSGSYTATYSYDSAGELTAADDSNSTYTLTYYNNGQVHQRSISYPGLTSMGTVTLTYAYDGFGNRTSLTDSAAGTSATTTYAYNNDFQLASLDFNMGTTNADLTFSYASDTGALSTLTMTGGTDTITAAFSYGTTTMGIVYSDHTQTFANFSYTLDNMNKVTAYTGPAGSSGFTSGTVSYAYDGKGQVSSVTGAETYTYSYDANGNRNSTGYTLSTGNEMTSAPSGTYSYDKNGNLTSVTDTSGDVWTYTWDYRNRLTQAVERNGTTTLINEQLTYDIFNNLIGVGTAERWTVYDGSNPYIDFNNSGSVTTRYLTDPAAIDQFYARVLSNGAVGWYFTDLTNSVREIVSENGTVLDQLNYDPFGNVLYESDSANGDRFKFQSAEYDSSLNLYHSGARWFDPVNGRWINQDPLSFAAGDTNLYRFINNDPSSFTDPTGMVVPTITHRRPRGPQISVEEWLAQNTVMMYPPIGTPPPSFLGQLWGGIKYYGGAAVEGLKEGAVNTAEGFVEGAQGTLSAVTHPLQTLDKLGQLGSNLISDPVGTASSIWDAAAKAWNDNPSKFCGNVAWNALFGAATLEAAPTIPDIPVPVPGGVVVDGGGGLALAPGAVVAIPAQPVVEAGGLFGILGGQAQMTAPSGPGGGPPAPPGPTYGTFEEGAGVAPGSVDPLESIGPTQQSSWADAGFTEAWTGYLKDFDEWWTAFKNPDTEEWGGFHWSSRNTW
jgi:RHS repeat-associated protein